MVALPTSALAQAGTDIYLVDLTRDDNVRFGTPVNVTNRAGYDNQPSFTPDGQGDPLHVSSRRASRHLAL